MQRSLSELVKFLKDNGLCDPVTGEPTELGIKFKEALVNNLSLNETLEYVNKEKSLV